MPRRRLGVVLVVPPPVQAEVDGLRRACGSTSMGRIPPHLTLVPPVNVREEDVGPALDLLRAAAGRVSAVPAELGPAETFHPESPVVYLAVGDEDALAAIHDLRRAVFTPPLERSLTYDFHPHVTLAEEVAEDRIGAMLSALANYRTRTRFDRLHLLQERRRDDGVRIWESIADFGLGGPAVVGRGGIELTLEVSATVPPDARELERVDVPGDAVTGASVDVVIVARRRGEVVGLVRGRLEGSLAVVDLLVVATAERRQGIGSRLLDRFEHTAIERGASVAEGVVQVGAGVAALLGGRGWVEVARVDEPTPPRVVLHHPL